MKHYLLILLICCLPITAFSQADSAKQPEIYTDSSTNYVELAGYGSTNGLTPFWMQANQFGIVPTVSRFGSARVGLEHYWPISGGARNTVRFGIGAEAVANIGEAQKVLLPQLHATLRFKNWEIFVGRKKQWIGLADSTIGSGSYAWSGNAMPIPKILIGTTKFVPVPLTKNWVSFQAFYSDGLFENSRPITSELKLHQKAFYLRIGKSHSLIKLYGGFNHQVQWGGKSTRLTGENDQMPKGFKNYLSVVTGAIGGSGTDITHFDSTSRIGNHLGSIDAALEIETYGASFLLYKQFVYEDGSLFYMTTLNDGLYGIRVKRKNSYGANFELTQAVLEMLYTKNQGGDQFVIGDAKLRGHDNYFNNQQVRDGWAYYDRTIGTPFVPPTSQTNWRWPNYADNMTSNNRVLLYHFGLKGTLFRRIEWQTRLSYSINYGTYHEPFIGNPTQFSGIFGMQAKLDVLGGMLLKGSYAIDSGELYRPNHGFMLGIRKDFSFY